MSATPTSQAASSDTYSGAAMDAGTTVDTNASSTVTAVTATLDHMPPATAGDPAAATAHETVGHEAHASGGLPQLEMQHWPGQMLWLVIIFVVFFVLIAKVFTPRLRKVINERGSRIAKDLANARAIRDEAEAQSREAKAEMAKAHADARKLADEAKARVNAESAAAQAAEDARLNVLLTEAETRIRAARDEALSHVTDIAMETASSLVEKLTGKAPTKTALNAALKKA